MRLDEPGSLLETGNAVSLQTAPAWLGTALLKFLSFASLFPFAFSLPEVFHNPELWWNCGDRCLMC